MAVIERGTRASSVPQSADQAGSWPASQRESQHANTAAKENGMSLPLENMCSPKTQKPKTRITAKRQQTSRSFKSGFSEKRGIRCVPGSTKGSPGHVDLGLRENQKSPPPPGGCNRMSALAITPGG